jgi:hypothetical protein
LNVICLTRTRTENEYGRLIPGPQLSWYNSNFVWSNGAPLLGSVTAPPATADRLGISPSHGAAMLSVVLGGGFLCRQVWDGFPTALEA